MEADWLGRSLMEEHSLRLRQPVCPFQLVPSQSDAAIAERSAPSGRRERIPVEEKVRHENLIFAETVRQPVRQVGHIKVLPRLLNLRSKLARRKMHHVPREVIRGFALTRPQSILGNGLIL